MIPIMLDLSEMNVLIVGAGKIAQRYLRKLLLQGCNIEVIAQEFNVFFDSKEALIKLKSFEESDLKGKDFIVAATDDSLLNERISLLAKSNGKLVVSATGVNIGNVSFGASKIIGDLSFMVTTNGKSPSLGKALIDEFASCVPNDIEERLELLGEIREAMKASKVENREKLLKGLIDKPIDVLRQRRKDYVIKSWD